MDFGVSTGDLIMILNGLVTLYQILKNSIPSFAKLLSEYRLFYSNVQLALGIWGSGNFSPEQQANARLIFRGCKQVLEGLKKFLYHRRSLGTGSPKLRDRCDFRPSKVQEWKTRIEEQKACLNLFHSGHVSYDWPEIRESMRFLVAREVSRMQGRSSLSLDTSDSLSTASDEHWTEIRHALKDRGISPKIFNRFKDEILLEVEAVVSDNAERANPPQSQKYDPTVGKALLEATEQGNWSAVRQMLADAAHIDINSLEVRLTFSLAVARQAWDIVESLVAQGFDSNGKSADLQPAICVAASRQAWDTVTFLAGKDADLEARDDAGHTPLLRAASCCNWAMVFLLANAGARVDTFAKAPADKPLDKPASRITVLSYAVTYGAWDQIERLLDLTADPNSVSLKGNPIITVAASLSRWDTVLWLVQRGAAVDAEDKVGKRASHYVNTALCKMWPKPTPEERAAIMVVAELLIEKGGHAGAEGSTALSPTSL
ncbi:ankyrin repeat-containing domain protein [Aspergillus recurvatus]